MMEVSLLISAGSGPRECEYAASGIARAYAQEAKLAGLSVTILETDNPGSQLLILSGQSLKAFLATRCGTVKWICQSPYRKHHKRKNWFVGVYTLPPPDQFPELDVKDITFTATRARGPGGQHVNKTNSAVRAVHRPTGLSVTAQEERSQHANKKLCLIKLSAIFSQRRDDNAAKTQRSVWMSHKGLERGNPVRVYGGEKFKLLQG
jgi:peptide chain release factor